MNPQDVSDGELSDYIITALAKQTGRGRGYWRRAIVGLDIAPDGAAPANWTLRLTGAGDYAAQVDQVIASLQQEFPFVVKR